jgi:hypothetical protein
MTTFFRSPDLQVFTTMTYGFSKLFTESRRFCCTMFV